MATRNKKSSGPLNVSALTTPFTKRNAATFVEQMQWLQSKEFKQLYRDVHKEIARRVKEATGKNLYVVGGAPVDADYVMYSAADDWQEDQIVLMSSCAWDEPQTTDVSMALVIDPARYITERTEQILAQHVEMELARQQAQEADKARRAEAQARAEAKERREYARLKRKFEGTSTTKKKEA